METDDGDDFATRHAEYLWKQKQKVEEMLCGSFEQIFTTDQDGI